MTFPRQVLGLLVMNLSGIGQRKASVLTIIVGVTAAVGVMVSMLAMGTGARRQETGDVRPDRVVLITTGTRPGQGNISRDEVPAILALPGLRKDADGQALVVFESTVFVEGRRRVTGTRIYFPLVGVSANVIRQRPEMRFTQGRMLKPGLHELIVSNPCVREFDGFGLGARRSVHGTGWTVVGRFDQGAAQQCVIYGDVDGIMSTFQRNTYSSATATLESASAFEAFRSAVEKDPSLQLEARREPDVARDAFKELNSLLDFISYFVGAIMAVGATLGAVNSLYAIVDARRAELATLRAIGFGAGAVMASILFESILLALPGAIFGAALAWILFNGLLASPFGYSIQLAVTPGLAAVGVMWAFAMGVVGGLLPGLRAARVSVSTALRAT
jgi:putative ABC transport system permease protein